MDIRNSFSRFKKKLKGSGRKRGETEADVDGESAHPTNSLPRQTDGRQVNPKDQPLQSDGPGPVPARGGENDQREREADANGREITQRDSRPDPDAGGVVGNGRTGEGDGKGKVERLDPSPSTPSILHDGKPAGM